MIRLLSLIIEDFALHLLPVMIKIQWWMELGDSRRLHSYWQSVLSSILLIPYKGVFIVLLGCMTILFN